MGALQLSALKRWSWSFALMLPLLCQAREMAETVPEVAIVRAVPVALAQADAARDGAAELVVLMEIARVQSQRVTGGVVGVGNRRGLFSCDAEEALRLAVLDGVPVVKLAPRGEVLPAPHGLFLDGGSLSEADASRVLAQCLVRYGAPPKAQSAQPSRRELAAIQKHLKNFQHQLTLATRTRLAAR